MCCLKSLKKRLWYLTQILTPLALFSVAVNNSIKENIGKILQQNAEKDEMKKLAWGRIRKKNPLFLEISGWITVIIYLSNWALTCVCFSNVEHWFFFFFSKRKSKTRKKMANFNTYSKTIVLILKFAMIVLREELNW